MKKIIFISAFLIIYTGCSNHLVVKNDLTRMNLFGKVKSVKNYSFRVDGNKKKDSTVVYVDKHFTFNLNGYIIEESEYFDGKFYSKETFKINDRLKLVEESKFNSNNKLYEKYTYKYLYNNKGVNIGGEKYNLNKVLVAKWSYKYNNSGKIYIGNEFDNKGNKIAEFWTAKYNKKGLKVEKVQHISSNKIYERWVYDYDPKGNMIKKSVYDTDGNLKNKSTYVYNEKGEEIESKTTFGSRENFLYKNKQVYDNLGNQIELISFDQNGKIESKSHTKYTEFDKYNNWIKAETFEFNKPQSILVRKIEYYN